MRVPVPLPVPVVSPPNKSVDIAFCFIFLFGRRISPLEFTRIGGAKISGGLMGGDINGKSKCLSFAHY
jgi:hypothetical protein